MRRIKSLIVFDIDGTLCDSVGLHQNAFAQALRKIGVQSVPSELNGFKYHTDSYIARTIYEADQKTDFSNAKLKAFEKLIWQAIQNITICEIPGAAQSLHYLHSQTDFGICFATGSLQKPAQHKLSSVGIPFKEEQLTTANEFEDREKIVEAAIKKALHFYQTESLDRIISVGDGLWDLVAAQNLNIEFIGIGAVNKEVMLEHGMTAHCNDFNDFHLRII